MDYTSDESDSDGLETILNKINVNDNRDGLKDEKSSFEGCKDGLKVMNYLVSKGKVCDMTIQVGDKKFNVHMNILTECSPYIRSLFRTKKIGVGSTVKLDEIDVSVIHFILDYAYTNEAVITKENCRELLRAASILKMNPLILSISDFIHSNLDIESCIDTWQFISQFNCGGLSNKIECFIGRHLSVLYQHEDFLKLDIEFIIKLLDNINFNADDEVIFEAIIKWYEVDKEKRNEVLPKMLSILRIPLLSNSFLFDNVLKYEPILKNEKCLKFVEEVKLYRTQRERKYEKKPSDCNPAFAMNPYIIAVGGENTSSLFNSVKVLCEDGKDWIDLNCFPFAISKHGLVSCQNDVYLAGGELCNGKVSNEFWTYNVNSNKWVKLPSLLCPRSELGLAVIGDDIYAVGGWDGQRRLSTVERYDRCTEMWTMIPEMPSAITLPGVVSYDQILFVVGGSVDGDDEGTNNVFAYNPYNSKWREMPNMLIPRSGCAVCVVKKHIYVMGGWHASVGVTNFVERFDTTDFKWEYVKSMCLKRNKPGATVINGVIYVVGGESESQRYHQRIEYYVPNCDKWILHSSVLSPGRSSVGCTTIIIQKSSMKRK